LDSLPQHLCWWFTWLEQLAEFLLSFYWVLISCIDLLDVMYRMFPLTHEIINEELSAVESLRWHRYLALLIETKCFEIHVFFSFHFVL
jgi:hypothetical protein